MHANWEFSADSLKRWENFVKLYINTEFPQRRRRRNIKRQELDLSKPEIWRVLIGCQITTQQRSGPNSNVNRFMNSDSPALSLRQCRASKSVGKLIENECSKAGLRRGQTVAANLERIFHWLESGGWDDLIAQLETLVTYPTPKKERRVVEYIINEKRFPGLGQKQSRNFLQWLGLSRYEIPLDSRVLKKMRDLGANFVPSGPALTDRCVYDFILNALQNLSARLNIYPCELDACIFSSFDLELDESSII